MANGLLFLAALIAVLLVMVWSVKNDEKGMVPRSGLFGLRPQGADFGKAKNRLAPVKQYRPPDDNRT